MNLTCQITLSLCRKSSWTKANSAQRRRKSGIPVPCSSDQLGGHTPLCMPRAQQQLASFWHLAHSLNSPGKTAKSFYLSTKAGELLTRHRVGEKFIDWSDETPALNDILDSITLYWFTETLPRNVYCYREVRSLSRRSWSRAMDANSP